MKFHGVRVLEREQELLGGEVGEARECVACDALFLAKHR